MTQPRRNSDMFNEADTGEFIIRHRILPVWQLLLIFLLSFLVLFTVATNAEMLGGNVGIMLAIFAVIGPLSWFTVYFSQQNRDMLLAAEFQNALFTAAARLKSKFIMIVKQDGTIFYFDRGFQHVFPETNSRGTLMLDKIFNSKQISAREADKITRALEENISETVFVHLQDSNGEPQKVIITIDPLPRPSGFFIMRGRDYVEKRAEQVNTQINSAKAPENGQISATIQHMLDCVPFGLYATDATGNILLANSRFAGWLGYSATDILNRKLTLSDLLSRNNNTGNMAENILVKNCEGEAQFTNKNDQIIPLYLQQEITCDTAGNMIGSIGIVRQEPPANKGLTSATMALETPPQEAPTLSPSLIAGKKF